MFVSEVPTMLFLNVTGVNGTLEPARVLSFQNIQAPHRFRCRPSSSLLFTILTSLPPSLSLVFSLVFSGRVEQLPSLLLLPFLLSLTRRFFAPPTELERLPQCVSSASCSKSWPPARPEPGPEPVPPGLGLSQKSLVGPGPGPGPQH